MKDSPLVSILMPVYNSYDFVRSENKNLITKAIDSLLGQTYKNFELIILDNQSTDNTKDICEKYAKDDPRIRFIMDTKRRYPEGGISQASTFAKGKYCMIANDDDLWDPSYVETLVNHMESHPDTDLCYTNGNFRDVHGNIIGKISTPEDHIYTSQCSPLSNLSGYLINRNPIPISFGLFKKECFLEMMPYEDFDNLKADVDNHLITKLFMRKKKIDFINKTLFNYRVKSRTLDPKKVPDMPGIERKDLIGFYYLRHQLFFLNKLISDFCEVYSPSQDQLDFIRSVFISSTIKHSSGLASWLLSQFRENDSSDKKLKSLSQEFSSIVKNNLKNFPKLGNFKNDELDNIRFEPILNLNLLKINLDSLEKILLIIDKTGINDKIISDTREIILFEISKTKDRIKDIESRTSKTPEILTEEKVKKGNINKKPKISVITASYNLAPFVEETMRSIANQNCDDFEHIVIDGGSTDRTLDLLKKYPDIILLSEKDTGYPDAFWKGLKLAKGEYILQCAISDGYATTEWLKKCCKILDDNKDISLVWGFAGRLTENSKLTAISRSQFHYDEAPQRTDMFNYWLKTFFVYPEGNLCVRKSVILKCYPTMEECSTKNILDWLEFSYRFNRLGYLSVHLPILANFGRSHGNQLGEQLGNDGSLKTKYKDFRRKITLYGLKLMLGLEKHNFYGPNDKRLDLEFDNRKFVKEYFKYKIENLFKIDKKYLQPEKYLRYLNRHFSKIKNHLKK